MTLKICPRKTKTAASVSQRFRVDGSGRCFQQQNSLATEFHSEYSTMQQQISVGLYAGDRWQEVEVVQLVWPQCDSTYSNRSVTKIQSTAWIEVVGRSDVQLAQQRNVVL